MLVRAQDARYDEAQSTRQLHLPYHRLRFLDARVWSLTQLTVLDLGHNSLTSLPPEIGQLVCLRELWANHNPGLAAPPREIAALQDLELLDLRCTAAVKLPRELARLPRLHDLRLAGCEATLDAKQAAVYDAGGTAALLAALAAKAARSDAKVALGEVLVFQLYVQEAATDAGRARVLGVVKAVARAFPELHDLRLITRNAGRLFPRTLTLGGDVDVRMAAGGGAEAVVAEVVRRHAELCADNARKKAAAEVELALRHVFFGQLDRADVEPLVRRVMAALPALPDVTFFLAHTKALLPPRFEDVTTERISAAAAALAARLAAERAAAVSKLHGALRAHWSACALEEVDAATAAVAPLVERTADLLALASEAAAFFPPDPRNLAPAAVVRAFAEAQKTKGLA